jgi:predicted nucleic acid-binding protein
VNFLLDTNVISEWAKPRPHPSVVAWLADADEERNFVSILSFAEIARGIALLPQGRRRERLSEWLQDDLPARFDGRVLGIDLAVATAWGGLMARSRRQGIVLGAIDGFFAATAAAFDLTLVTRNVKDFDRLGLRLHNPWTT